MKYIYTQSLKKKNFIEKIVFELFNQFFDFT